MTDELHNFLKEHHKEELTDNELYLSMAKKAEDDGCSRMAGILRDIAHDEMSHANAIAHILEH